MPQQHISSYENGEKYERIHTRSLIYVKYESTGCGRYEMEAEKDKGKAACPKNETHT